MIPVKLQGEPKTFAKRVRAPGVSWLKTNSVAANGPVPKGLKLPPYWRECLKDLHDSYDGVCAYICVYIERCVGGTSVDHFVAKSKAPHQAYEWDNYRLACTTMNSRKRDYSTVLDPFTLPPDTFHLELVTGRIYPNPTLSAGDKAKANETIRRLKLDDPCREIRSRRYDDYLGLRRDNQTAAESHLRRYSPFIWYEAKRQGLL